jgi:ZIP family zinc transporter
MTSVVLNAFLLSLCAGLATGIGGAIVIALRRFGMRTYDTLVGFAAGVMTSIAILGLIHEALNRDGILVSVLGATTGAAMLYFMDRYLPHEHQHLTFECVDVNAYRRGILVMAALALHNIPEGLAVGTSYAAQPRLGLMLALAIALHNIPEGMAIAGPLRACGMPALRILSWTLFAGLSEPVAAVIGAVSVGLVSGLLSFSLAFAGGAMLYVVSDELIPESHSHGYEHQATFGFMVGVLLLMCLMRIV